MWGPSSGFAAAAWCFDTIYGVGVSTAAERVGESPCPALGRGERPPPRGAPTLPTQCWQGARGGAETCQAPACQPLSLRLPPPSPPSLLQEEIQQLKSKLEKVEKERNELRLNSDRLESRVGPCQHQDGVQRCTGLSRAPTPWSRSPPHPQITELTSELTDERNTGESASQLLDAETAERLRAEKEMKDLQVHASLPGLAAPPAPLCPQRSPQPCPLPGQVRCSEEADGVDGNGGDGSSAHPGGRAQWGARR